MYKLVATIFLALCTSLTSWSTLLDSETVDYVKWNGVDESGVYLLCETAANDTVWTLSLVGYVDDDFMLLIKTGDNKVISLKPYSQHNIETIDSVGYNPITGEPVNFYSYTKVLRYRISTDDLKYIAQHCVVKLRCGTVYKGLNGTSYSNYKDKVYRHNEFGAKLIKAYKKILKKMSPDYVPPKEPTIYDGF